LRLWNACAIPDEPAGDRAACGTIRGTSAFWKSFQPNS
jgi:hypothetical protein